MIKVSPSSIGFLRECPRCLWLYFKEGVQRPRGPFPTLPSGMDEVLKDYFDKFRSKNELPPEIRDKVGERLYSDIEKMKRVRSVFKGLVAEFPDYNLKLKGAIDELLINDQGSHVLLDFKTRGFPIKKDTHEHYRDQLDLYALLLKMNDMPPAEYGYLMFLHPTAFANHKASFTTEVVKLDVDWKRGILILREVYAVLQGPVPQAHTDCEYCLYRATNFNALGL